MTQQEAVKAARKKSIIESKSFIVIHTHGEGCEVCNSDFDLDRQYYHGEGGKKMFFTHIATIEHSQDITYTRASEFYLDCLVRFRKQFKDIVKMTCAYVNDNNRVFAGEWVDNDNVPNLNSGFAPDVKMTIKFID